MRPQELGTWLTVLRAERGVPQLLLLTKKELAKFLGDGGSVGEESWESPGLFLSPFSQSSMALYDLSDSKGSLPAVGTSNTVSPLCLCYLPTSSEGSGIT